MENNPSSIRKVFLFPYFQCKYFWKMRQAYKYVKLHLPLSNIIHILFNSFLYIAFHKLPQIYVQIFAEYAKDTELSDLIAMVGDVSSRTNY